MGEGLFFQIGRYFWALALLITAYQYAAGMRLLRSYDATDPRASPAAIALRRQFAVLGSVPWAIMGWGILAGGVPNVWYFFRPQDGNPYVLAWIGSIFVLAFGFAFWVFMLDGAQKVVVLKPIELKWYRTGFRRTTQGTVQLTVGRVKLFAALAPFWVALWTWLVWSIDAPLPK